MCIGWFGLAVTFPEWQCFSEFTTRVWVTPERHRGDANEFRL